MKTETKKYTTRVFRKDKRFKLDPSYIDIGTHEKNFERQFTNFLFCILLHWTWNLVDKLGSRFIAELFYLQVLNVGSACL